jgi:hypothetical protein
MCNINEILYGQYYVLILIYKQKAYGVISNKGDVKIG